MAANRSESALKSISDGTGFVHEPTGFDQVTLVSILVGLGYTAAPQYYTIRLLFKPVTPNTPIRLLIDADSI